MSETGELAVCTKVKLARSDIANNRSPWNLPLRQQLRWMRITQKPYLTQSQLAQLAGVNTSTITEFETGEHANMQLQTLRKVVRALGCELYIKIELKPYRGKAVKNQFLVEGPALPRPPKLIRKGTERARWQAEEYARLMGKTPRQFERARKAKAISGNPDLPKSKKSRLDPDNPFDFDARKKPPKPPGTKSPIA